MYDRDETEASKSALIERGIALVTYRDDFVLAGGGLHSSYQHPTLIIAAQETLISC